MATDAPTVVSSIPIPDDELHAWQLLLLCYGGRLQKIIEVLVELDIAGQLSDGPKPVSTLAVEAQVDETALHRLLRLTATVGIFGETDPGVFEMTPIATGLLKTTEGIVPLVRYNTMDMTTRPFDELMHSVRTGEPAFEKTFGKPLYQYLKDNTADREFFEKFMGHWARQMTEEEMSSFGLERFSRVADLGGSDGYFLGQALRRHPCLHAALLDLPDVVTDAPAVLEEHGVTDRVEVLAGDFFTDPLPADCDVYLLKAVLHNWSDAKAEELLHRVRERIGDSGATLLVWDQVMAEGNTWDHAKLLDVDMLVLYGGRERTITAWRELFARTGFELQNDPINHWTILECKPSQYK